MRRICISLLAATVGFGCVTEPPAVPPDPPGEGEGEGEEPFVAWRSVARRLSVSELDNTIRDVTCELCHGRQYAGGDLQPVGNQLIQYRFAKKLAAIPGCEIGLSGASRTELHFGHRYRPVLFRSDFGIAGIVMPILR